MDQASIRYNNSEKITEDYELPRFWVISRACTLIPKPYFSCFRTSVYASRCVRVAKNGGGDEAILWCTVAHINSTVLDK